MKSLVEKCIILLVGFIIYCFPSLKARVQWERRGKIYRDEDLSDDYLCAYNRVAGLCVDALPQSLLEIGCGYGELLKRIWLKADRSQDIELVGLDFSRSQIKQARSFFPRGVFIHGDLTRKLRSFYTNRFDVVVSFSVLMYCPPSKIVEIMSELHRICRKRLIIAEYYYKYLDLGKQNAYLDVSHLDHRFPHDYFDLLQQSGFVNIEAISLAFEGGEMPMTVLSCEVDPVNKSR